MKTLLLIALAVGLLIPALPGGAATTPPSTTTFAQTTDTSSHDARLTYAGRSLTSALSLTILGQGLQTGVTNSRVANAATTECQGVACSVAAGAAEPIGENAVAVSPGNPGPNSVQAFDLGADASPELEQLLTLAIGRATAQTSDVPFSTGTADGVSLDLTLNQTILGQLPTEVTGGLDNALGQIADALSPIAEGDPTGTIGSVTGVLDGLVGDPTSAPLLRVQAGQSTSSSQFREGRVSANAAAAGAVIVILPTPVSTPLVPEGLAIIEVAPSSAAATADGRNRATAEARGSIARITLLPGLLEGVEGLDPGAIEGLPLDDILDLLPDEVTDLLPIDDLNGLIGGGDDDDDDDDGDGGPTATPIDDTFGEFIQADRNTGGFVIDLETNAPQTCIFEGTPVETCITVGGTNETFTADGLGVGVLAAGVDVSLARGLGEMAGSTTGGLIDLSLGRSEAGVAAEFVQAPAPPPPPPPPARPALPQTGPSSSMVLPSLLLMALSGVALVTLRRRRES